jgi:hypothetical protein
MEIAIAGVIIEKFAYARGKAPTEFLDLNHTNGSIIARRPQDAWEACRLRRLGGAPNVSQSL